MKKYNLKYKTFLLVFFAGIFCFSKIVECSNFIITKNINNEVGIGEYLEIFFKINTENESINAIQGEINFDNKKLEVESINDGNSILNMWVEKPQIKLDNKITFSGITPGGYNGELGNIFSVIFKTKEKGYGSLYFDNLKALINDGVGTESKIEKKDLKIFISEKILGNNVLENNKDTEAPEFFEPIISRDKDIFNDKYFIVFNAQDKESGIDHYEICEGERKCGKTTENIYLLSNQNLDDQILVKAFDKNNNYRISIIPKQKGSNLYKNIVYFGIIILVIIIFFVARTKTKRSK